MIGGCRNNFSSVEVHRSLYSVTRGCAGSGVCRAETQKAKLIRLLEFRVSEGAGETCHTEVIGKSVCSVPVKQEFSKRLILPLKC